METNDQKTLIELSSEVSALKSGFNELKVSVNTLAQAFHNRQVTNWPLVMTVLGAAMTFLVGGWVLVRLQTENVIAPVVTQSAVSVKHREAISASLEALSDRVNREGAALQALQASMTAKLIEVETQFRAADQVRNVQTASQMRLISLLWRRAYGEEFPHHVYYPAIAQPHP